MIAQYEKAGAGNLMSKRLDRYDSVPPTTLAFVKAFGAGHEAHREVRRLEKCPSEKRIAVLAIGFAFFLAVDTLFAVHTPTIGGELPGAVEAMDVAHFPHDRHRQNRPDTVHVEQLFVLRCEPHAFDNSFSNRSICLRKAPIAFSTAVDAEPEVFVRDFRPYARVKALDRAAVQPNCGGTPHLILDRQHASRAMLDEAHALTGKISYAALCFRIDVPCWQDPEPHQMRQPERIVSIVRMLETFVLLDGGDVHEPDDVAWLPSNRRPASTN
jgi:hypothetical protein